MVKMSSKKRKQHSEDAGNDLSPSKKKTKHVTTKISSKAQKRPRSVFEKPRTYSSGGSDSNFQDDTDNDPDWTAEKQIESSEDEAPDMNGASTKNSDMVEHIGKRKKENKIGKKRKKKKGKKAKETDSPENEVQICYICQKKIKGSLMQHLKRNHSFDDKEEMAFTCDICERGFSKQVYSEQHKLKHAEDESFQTANGVFKCLNCMKCYDDQNKLTAHRRRFCPLNAVGGEIEKESDDEAIRTVEQLNSEGAFKCDICSSQFECFSELQAHAVIHMKSSQSSRKKKKTKFVKCPKCDVVCGNFTRLSIHNEVVHINKGMGVYKCKICKQGFGHKSLLKYHEKDKHGEDQMTYKCQQCHLIFKTRHLRQKHIRQVHAAKSVCEYCGKFIKRMYLHTKRCPMNPNNVEQSKKHPSENTAAVYISHKTGGETGSRSVPESVSSSMSRSKPVGRPISTVTALLRKPESERYECQKCCISFENKANYVVHERTCQLAVEQKNSGNYHDSGEKQPEQEVYACEECPEIFNGMLNFLVHEAKHNMVVCKDCNVVVPDTDTLELHVMLECPEKYKTFLNRTSSIETDAHNLKIEGTDARVVDDTAQENEKSGNCFGSTPTTSTDENIDTVNKRMNDVPGDNKLSVSEEKVGNINETKDNKKNKTNADQRHVCNSCNRESYDLQRHEEAHKNDRQRQSKTGCFKCPHCLKRYDAESNLFYHNHFLCPVQDLKQKGINGAFTCRSCLEKFDSLEHLRMHQTVHVVHVTKYEKRKYQEASRTVKEGRGDSLDKKNTINVEEMDLDNQDNMETKSNVKEIHSANNNQDESQQFVCDRCNMEYTSAAALNEHKKCVSLTTLKYPHKCALCVGSAQYRPLIVNAGEHLQHKKDFKFVCVFCGRHFEDGRNLERHIKRSHDYLNRKECSGCHQSFGPQEYLQHLDYNRKELERLKSKCLSCGKVLKSPEHLDQHARSYLNYTCTVCWQHFPNLDKLAMHSKLYHNIHDPEKRPSKHCLHGCKHCNQFFNTANELSAHVKSVLEGNSSSESLLCSWEYKYSTCLRCGMTFTKRSDYRLHKFLLHYGCQVCPLHFETEGMLRSHYIGTHSYNASLHTAGTDHMPRIFKCKYCGHLFDKVTDKIQHESKVGNKSSRYGNMIFPFPCENEECDELLSSPCQVDIHRIRHKGMVPTYVSCRFCHLKLSKHAYNHHHSVLDVKCWYCGIQLYSSCQKKVHMKNSHKPCSDDTLSLMNSYKPCSDDKLSLKNSHKPYSDDKLSLKNSHTQTSDDKLSLQCKYCGKQFQFNHHKLNHEMGSVAPWGQARCSVCAKNIAICQVAQHMEHVTDKIKGKICAFCLELIPSDISAKHYFPQQISVHKMYQDKFYRCRCGCGETVQAECKKRLYATFKCYKCNAHFQTYQELITHLLKFNIGNTMISTGHSGLASMELIPEKTTWNTCQEEEKTIYMCLYCGEKVDTYEDMIKHKSNFRYECPQCEKHFRTPLEANHHFWKVNHDKAPQSKGRQKITKKSAKPTGSTKRKKMDDDILTIYSQQSVCDQLYQPESQQLSDTSTMEFQIGVQKYSILTSSNVMQVTETISIGEMPVASSSEIPVSNRNEMPVPSSSYMIASGSRVSDSDSSSATPKSILSTNEAKQFLCGGAKKKSQTCIHCKRLFISSKLYEQHLCGNGQDTKGLLYTCIKCGSSFDVVCGVAYHIARICKYCGMHYTNVESKLDHEQQCRTVTYTMNSKISGELMADESKEIIVGACRGESRTQDEQEQLRGSVEEEIDAREVGDIDNKESSLYSKHDMNAEVNDSSDEKEASDHKELAHGISGENDRVAASRKESKSQVKETDQVHEESGVMETISEAEVNMVVSRNEVEEDDSSVHNVQRNREIQLQQNNPERRSFRVRKKKEKQDFVMSFTKSVKRKCDIREDAAKIKKKSYQESTTEDNSQTKVENENVSQNLSNEMIAERKSQAIEKFIMSLTMPVTRKSAAENEKKCDFCLQLAKRPVKDKELHLENLPCFQKAEYLKWMRCVCLYCNLELPNACHIMYHLARYARDPYQCPKKNCQRHFMTLMKRRTHNCQSCALCGRINFATKDELEGHTNNWHVMQYDEIPIPKEEIPNMIPEQKAHDSTKTDKALAVELSKRQPSKQTEQAKPSTEDGVNSAITMPEAYSTPDVSTNLPKQVSVMRRVDVSRPNSTQGGVNSAITVSEPNSTSGEVFTNLPTQIQDSISNVINEQTSNICSTKINKPVTVRVTVKRKPSKQNEQAESSIYTARGIPGVDDSGGASIKWQIEKQTSRCAAGSTSGPVSSSATPEGLIKYLISDGLKQATTLTQGLAILPRGSASSQVKIQPAKMMYMLKPQVTSGVTATTMQSVDPSITVAAQSLAGIQDTRSVNSTYIPSGLNPVVVLKQPVKSGVVATAVPGVNPPVTVPAPSVVGILEGLLKPPVRSGVVATAVQGVNPPVTVAAPSVVGIQHTKPVTSGGLNPVVTTRHEAMKTMPRVSASSQVKVPLPANITYVSNPPITPEATTTAMQRANPPVTAQTVVGIQHSNNTIQVSLTSIPCGLNPVGMLKPSVKSGDTTTANMQRVNPPVTAGLQTAPGGLNPFGMLKPCIKSRDTTTATQRVNTPVTAALQTFPGGLNPFGMLKPCIKSGDTTTATQRVNTPVTLAAMSVVGIQHSKYTLQEESTSNPSGLNPVYSSSDMYAAKQGPVVQESIPHPSRTNASSIATERPYPQVQTPITSSSKEGNSSNSLPMLEIVDAPATTRTKVSVLPGGFDELCDLMSTRKTFSGRKIIGETEESHFVVCHSSNNHRYLSFNHPASHKAVLSSTSGRHNDTGFSVMIMEKDENNMKPVGEKEGCGQALVVDIGEFEVHSINKLINSPGSYMYMVELAKPVPIVTYPVSKYADHKPTTRNEENIPDTSSSVSQVVAASSTTRTNYSVFPGGLEELYSVMRTANTGVSRKIMGEIGSIHYVVCHTINNQSYLSFHYPASHKGLLCTIGQQADMNFCVMITKNVENNITPQRGTEISQQALVVHIGQFNVHAIRRLNDCGNCAYIVELTALPMTTDEVIQRPNVTSKEELLTVPAHNILIDVKLPVTTNQVNSKLHATTSEVHSTLPVTTNKVNLIRPLVTTKENSSLAGIVKETNSSSLTAIEVNQRLPVVREQINSRPQLNKKGVNSAVPIITEVNSSLGAPSEEQMASASLPQYTTLDAIPQFQIVPGGLVGFTSILFGKEHALLSSKLLIGDKAKDHFIECVTVDNESYLTFNHLSNHTAVITTCVTLDKGKQLRVEVTPKSIVDQQVCCREALVVQIGECKVSKCLMFKQDTVKNTCSYLVDLY